MRIFLTGGAGFIGTSLIQKLEYGNEITIFDNLERNAIKFSNTNKIKLIQGDILDSNSLGVALRVCRPEIIIHLAAVAGVDNVINRPIRTMEVNIIGTHNLLKLVVENNIKLNKFISFSTSEVYGNYSYKLGEYEKTNLGAVGEARWSYSVSKLAAEHLCWSFYKEYDIPIVSIRPFNIYGPNQVGEGAIQIFLNRCLKDEDIKVYGDGSQIRSWCYIDDAVDLILKCIEIDESIGNVFNMGNPSGTITTIGLAEKIIKVTKAKSKIKFVPTPYIDIELRIPNIEKAKSVLGFEPKINLDEGLDRTYKWYRSIL